MYDVNQARNFIRALTGFDTSVVTFQVFFDPKNEPIPSGLAQSWTSTLDASLEFIDHKQSNYCGVYVCINGTDGTGREEENITDLRVLFADFDGMTEPNWVLPPHFVQTRDATHGHAFWLIDGSDLDNDEWSILQKQVAMYYGTDEQVIDPSRVVRLPGSLHYKDRNAPATYTMKSDRTGDGHRYRPQEIRDAHMLPPELDAKLEKWAEARAGILEGVGYEAEAPEIKKFTGFITNAAHPAVQGSGSHELYRVACFGHDHGVPLNVAQELLWEHYNPRCLPPWRDDERRHFNGVVHRAYKYSVSAPGCKTFKAALKQMVPLPEPSCGWDNMAAQFQHEAVLTADSVAVVNEKRSVVEGNEGTRSEHRISSGEAGLLLPQMTPKSSHYDFARIFDGANYDGMNLIRSKKMFYEFNGRSWSTIDDDSIKSRVMRSFSVFKPADAMTSGIFRVVADLVNVPEVENGTWITDPSVDTSNLAVFQNGIVDLSAVEPKVMPHSSDFFTLNELSYDFDPSAKCPKWLEFLTSIWGNNEVLKRQLQQFFGYCLTNDTSLQKFATLMGRSRAGKGVITDVLSRMVGDENTASPSLSNLCKDSALCEMSTKSLTLIPDAHKVHQSVRDGVLSNLKAITGGDPVSFHELYKGSRNTRFATKIVLSTNNMPEFNDPSGALVNRMLVFPFSKSFEGRENPHLRSELFNEIAGITQWAIAGLRDLRANNNRFVEAPESKVEKDEMRRDMFPLSHYVETMCTVESGLFTMVDDLYNGYRLWAATQGVKTPMVKQVFTKTLRNSALDINYVPGMKAGFQGITVRDQFSTGNVVGFPPVN